MWRGESGRASMVGIQRPARRTGARAEGHPADHRRIAAVLMMRDLGPGAWGLRACRRVSVAIVVVISIPTLGPPSTRTSAQAPSFSLRTSRRSGSLPMIPSWHEPMTHTLRSAMRYEPDLAYQTLDAVRRPGDKARASAPRTATPSTKCRTVRTSRIARAACRRCWRSSRAAPTPATVPHPARGSVVSAKSDGVTPGFTIRDTANQLWFISSSTPAAGAPWRPAAKWSARDASGPRGITPPNIAQLEPGTRGGKDTRMTPPGEMRRGR